MRGRYHSQVTMLAFTDLETRVPSDHPLRVIKRLAGLALKALSPETWAGCTPMWAVHRFRPRGC